MFSFDPTIKAGDLLQIAAFLCVGIGAYFGMKAKIAEIAATQKASSKIYDLRLSYIDAALEDAKLELKSSQTQDMHIAQQRKEIDKLWEIVNELRHWKGFVNPSGEYDRNRQIRGFHEDQG